MHFKKHINKMEYKRLLLRIILPFAVFIALVARLIFASMAQHPGHADPAFYYTVAENIVDGRWFQIDYIWNYLDSPQSISHSSLGYWMPLTSLLISLSLLVLGKSLFAALLPSIFAGMALSAVAYNFAIAYSDSRLVALCSSGLILFVPTLFEYSLLTDSAIYYALFASCSLLCMTKGRTNPRLFLVAAVLAG